MPVSKQQGHLGESHPVLWQDVRGRGALGLTMGKLLSLLVLVAQDDWVGVEKYTVAGR